MLASLGSEVSRQFEAAAARSYVAPKKIEGIQTRVDPTGCTTEIQLTITATDANDVAVTNKVLDPGCGFNRGDVFYGTASRQQ